MGRGGLDEASRGSETFGCVFLGRDLLGIREGVSDDNALEMVLGRWTPSFPSGTESPWHTTEQIHRNQTTTFMVSARCAASLRSTSSTEICRRNSLETYK